MRGDCTGRGLRGGIDLGGTKIQAVVVDADHVVLGQARRPTPTTGGPADIAAAIAEALREAAAAANVDRADLTHCGVGSPGTVDADAGTVSSARNLPDWAGVYPLAKQLRKHLGTAVALGNDVQVATNAEAALGAGRDHDSMLGVFWGTGVGGGIVLDGRPWVGRGGAGEIGHVCVKVDGLVCPCGRHGCMEAYAGRNALEQHARALHEKGEPTELFKIAKKRGRERLTSGIWAAALERDDPVATKLIDRAVAMLGAGVASCDNVLDVEIIILGGGLGVRLGQPYADRIAEAMLPHLFFSDRPPPVVVAALGDLGGAIGASLLVPVGA
ncbi:MAG TPA: ROK family protein [Solirubrobacteraceae bacterium]|nr:ROK family protein [Solirubrobacteraceae bacterium]